MLAADSLPACCHWFTRTFIAIMGMLTVLADQRAKRWRGLLFFIVASVSRPQIL
jgi:hypothetical protein